MVGGPGYAHFSVRKRPITRIVAAANRFCFASIMNLFWLFCKEKFN